MHRAPGSVPRRPSCTRPGGAPVNPSVRLGALVALVGLLLAGGVAGVLLHDDDATPSATPTASTTGTGTGTTGTTADGTATTTATTGTGAGTATTSTTFGSATTVPAVGVGTATPREPLAATGPASGSATGGVALLGLAALVTAARRRAGRAAVDTDHA